MLIILALILVVNVTLICVNTFKANSTVAATTAPSSYSGNSVDFSSGNGYEVNTDLTASPKTFEIFVKLNTTNGNASDSYTSYNHYGVVMGNYKSTAAANDDCFMIDFLNTRKPRIYWNNYYANTADTGRYYATADKQITAGEWTHIAFVRDTTNNQLICYINGEKVTS